MNVCIWNSLPLSFGFLPCRFEILGLVAESLFLGDGGPRFPDMVETDHGLVFGDGSPCSSDSDLGDLLEDEPAVDTPIPVKTEAWLIVLWFQKVTQRYLPRKATLSNVWDWLKHQNLCMFRNIICLEASLKCICEKWLAWYGSVMGVRICISGKGLLHIRVYIFVWYKRATAFLHYIWYELFAAGACRAAVLAMMMLMLLRPDLRNVRGKLFMPLGLGHGLSFST